MHVKIFSLKIDRVDPHMDQNPVSCCRPKPNCMFRVHHHLYRTVHRRVDLSFSRNDGNAVAEHLLCKSRIIYFLDPDELACCKRSDLLREFCFLRICISCIICS